MMVEEREILVESLRRDQAVRAYAVIQAALPQLGLEQWLRFVEATGAGEEAALPFAEAPSGILLARDPEGLLLGLVTYHRVQDLRHGALLCGGDLIAFGLPGRRPVAERLLEALEAEAVRLGCSALRLSLPQETAEPAASSPFATLLQARGHRVESLVLCKPLPPGRS